MHTYYYAVTNESKKEIIGMYSSEAKSVEDFEKEYNRQVRHYCRAMEAMGYPKVSGWLLFLQPRVHVRRVPLGEDV